MNVTAHVRVAVLAATALLILAVLAWILMPIVTLGRFVWAALVTLPLWIFIPALHRGERRKYAAMTLCVVPYLVLALTELVANPVARIQASAILLLAFALFALLIAFLRVTRPRGEGITSR
jgi:uncharacterized membrane protein